MASQDVSAQTTEGKANAQGQLYFYRLSPAVHGSLVEGLSTCAGVLEDAAHRLDVLGDVLHNLKKTPELHHAPSRLSAGNDLAKSSLELTKPLDDLVSEILACAGLSKLMEVHIVGCSDPDIEDLFSGLHMLTCQLEHIANTYNEGELRERLLKMGVSHD